MRDWLLLEQLLRHPTTDHTLTDAVRTLKAPPEQLPSLPSPAARLTSGSNAQEGRTAAEFHQRHGLDDEAHRKSYELGQFIDDWVAEGGVAEDSVWEGALPRRSRRDAGPKLKPWLI